MRWKIVVLVVGALAVLVAALMVAGAGPGATAVTLFKGSMGSAPAWTGTLRETTPLLLLGLSVFVALRAGLFNIGADGQFLVGALSAAVIACRLPGFAGMALACIAGFVAGGLWALPAGLIKAYRNGHEVITTIMLNSVGVLLTGALVAGPFKDPQQQSRTTSYVLSSTRVPPLVDAGPFQVNGALLAGVIGAILLAFWLRRFVAGYELETVGANPVAARFAGISTTKVTIWAMTVSGAIAGFAGALQVLAYEGRFYEGFSPGYGFNALGVALLAGNDALGVLPASLLFGALEKGGTSLAVNGVPKGITFVILGFIILIAAAIRYRRVVVVA